MSYPGKYSSSILSNYMLNHFRAGCQFMKKPPFRQHYFYTRNSKLIFQTMCKFGQLLNVWVLYFTNKANVLIGSTKYDQSAVSVHILCVQIVCCINHPLGSTHRPNLSTSLRKLCLLYSYWIYISWMILCWFIGQVSRFLRENT